MVFWTLDGRSVGSVCYGDTGVLYTAAIGAAHTAAIGAAYTTVIGAAYTAQRPLVPLIKAIG